MGFPLLNVVPEQSRTTPAQDEAERRRNAPGNPEKTRRIRLTIEVDDQEPLRLDRVAYDQERRDRLAELLSSLAYLSANEATVHVVSWRQQMHNVEVDRIIARLRDLVPAPMETPAEPVSAQRARKARA